MIGPGHRPPEEWLLQADYDMDTAQYMFDGGRYFYTIFMCHLSIEKAIKSLYSASLKVEPPKLHDLLYFSNRLRLSPPSEVRDLLYELNGLSVLTRYPDELRKMALVYDRQRCEDILTRSRKALEWLKEQLPNS